MSNPYIGEIRIFAGSFAPAGWAMCDGQLMPIAENDALFVVIGTTYGGDGQETFALPNLRSRFPIHQGNGFVIGEQGGTEEVTLTTGQIPSHSHPALCKGGENTGTSPTPLNNVWASQSAFGIYTTTFTSVQMNAQAIGIAGGSQPHENMIPFLGLHFIISLFGIFPSQT